MNIVSTKRFITSLVCTGVCIACIFAWSQLAPHANANWVFSFGFIGGLCILVTTYGKPGATFCSGILAVAAALIWWNFEHLQYSGWAGTLAFVSGLATLIGLTDAAEEE